jgi:uncharacterized protein
VAVIPECLACGACCFSRLETFVRVTGDDYARMADRAESLVRFDGFRGYMRMADEHCAALVVDVASGRWMCGAYAVRPQVCRDLARSSGECLAELDAKADRPLMALRQAR